jgi:hypothetical protein
MFFPNQSFGQSRDAPAYKSELAHQVPLSLLWGMDIKQSQGRFTNHGRNIREIKSFSRLVKTDFTTSWALTSVPFKLLVFGHWAVSKI